MDKETVTASLPFSGFYDSIHSDRLDRVLIDEELPIEEQDKLFDEIDWKKEQINYAKGYTDIISELLGMPLQFEELDSPREYNFRTDRIFVKIQTSDVQKLKELVDYAQMKDYVRQHFTSRDGFSSYYENDYDEWLKQEEEFDHNQICSLISVYLNDKEGEHWEEELLEKLFN